MGDRIMTRDRVSEFVGMLMQTNEVIAPVLIGEQTFFRPVRSPGEVRWDIGNATVSPTEFLLPQSETLFSYERRGSDVNLSYEVDETPRAIVGIRSCDVHGLRMMDRVFTGQYEDPYYVTRRKHTTLIALMCNEPGASCFCDSFGTGPDLEAGSGADLLLVDLQDRFYVRVLSDHGETLMGQCNGLSTEATEADREAVQQARAESVRKMSRALDMEGLPEALGRMFDSPYWDKISRKCISCGACTYLCPVCYCFDVSETCSSVRGERTRCWDACTYKSFAMLAGGHNPRPTIAEGYRQKMYHKFQYAVDRYGEPLCVGCGRCQDSCPVNLDIVRVLTEAKELMSC